MRIKRTNDTDENNQRKQLSHDKQFLADPKIEKEFGVKLKIIIDKQKDLIMNILNTIQLKRKQ